MTFTKILDNNRDEGMVVDNDQYPSYSSDSEEEKDYFRIRKTDSLIFAATEEEDLSNMEVYIYNY